MSLRDLSAQLDELGHRLLPSALSKIETGERRIDVDDLAALALALGSTPHILMGWPEGSVDPTTVEDIALRFLDLRAEMERLGSLVDEIREKGQDDG